MIEFVAEEERRLMIELEDDTSPAVIKVIGVGGGGCNAVNRMIAAGVKGVQYVTCNTDLQVLRRTSAPSKIQIGSRLTKGLGAGADPDIGRNAALEDQEKLAEAVKGVDMVFLTAGLGGGTGSGAAPIIAKLAADAGALTVAVVTKPFEFEGKKRMRQAERSARELRDHVDSLVTIPNERLLSFIEPGTTLPESFKIADDVLRQGIQGISDLINCPGVINLDFADVRRIMSDMGRALMGTAVAEGENRAVHAAQAAMSSPLLEDASIDGARGVLINVTGGPDLTLHEFNEAAQIIRQTADPEAEIKVGWVSDERMAGSVKITVIATGFDRGEAEDLPEPIGPPPQRGRHFPRGDESGGFGPNVSTRVDDFDIPTVLRRQMD